MVTWSTIITVFNGVLDERVQSVNDLCYHFKISHPLALRYLHFLDEIGLILMTLDGREYKLSVTKKGLEYNKYFSEINIAITDFSRRENNKIHPKKNGKFIKKDYKYKSTNQLEYENHTDLLKNK